MAWNRWQVVTLASLTAGYAGYYVCRSNFSITTSLIMAEQGMSKAEIGGVASAGVLAYAIGKVLNGVVGDFLGGRTVFLLAMVASVAATIIFGMSTGVVTLTAIWCANRFVQSAGWGGATKVVGLWFDQNNYGRAMAILSLSYLFGDVVARLALGEALRLGASWRQIFFIAAAGLGVITVGVFTCLKARPQQVGLPGAQIAEGNVYGAAGDSERPESIRTLLGPLLRRPSFWMVCVMSLGLTLIRETFNFWTPTYLIDTAGLSTADAAKASSLFPFFGGVAVIVAGFVSDGAAKGRRAAVMCAFLVPGAVAMLVLGYYSAELSTPGKLVMVSILGFLIIGPYSFLAGAISLDMGSKRGAATTAGIVDAAGYIGGMLSGRYVGSLAEGTGGWATAFGFLGIVCVLTTIAAALYWWMQESRQRPSREHATVLDTEIARPVDGLPVVVRTGEPKPSSVAHSDRRGEL